MEQKIQLLSRENYDPSNSDSNKYLILHFYRFRHDPQNHDLIINMGEPNDRSQHARLEAPSTNVGLGSYITLNIFGHIYGRSHGDILGLVKQC